jgi:hypothetical protein
MGPTALKLPVTASTQEHLTVEDIQEDLVILKDGGVAMILETTAVNFGLLSETEQDAAIYAYAGLLNSLTFPVQIVIRSRYRQFIESIIRENNVLDKRFYIIIPFSPLELGAPRAAVSLAGMLNPFKKDKQRLPYPKDYILEKAKNAIYPKKDHITRQLARIGLRAEQLTTQQLIELFYDIYNPTQISSQKITASASDYTTPLVSPAVEEEESKKPKIPTKTSVTQPPDPVPEPPKPSGEVLSPSPSTTPQAQLPQSSPPQSVATSSPPQPPETKASPPTTSTPGKPLTTPSGAEPGWIKRVQQKVQEDKDSQPRLTRTQPQPQQKDQPKIIGGRVATPPGGVSQQTKSPTPPPPLEDNQETNKRAEKTIFKS